MLLAESVHRERYEHQMKELSARQKWARKVDGPAFNAYLKAAEKQRPTKKPRF